MRTRTKLPRALAVDFWFDPVIDPVTEDQIPFTANSRGLTFCWDCTIVACGLEDKVNDQYLNPTARRIIIACLQKHKDTHKPDLVPCPDECTLIRWGSHTEETSQVASECRATVAQLKHLQAQFFISPDKESEKEVRSEYIDMMSLATKQCREASITVSGLPGNL